jgi:hypothetical protein
MAKIRFKKIRDDDLGEMWKRGDIRVARQNGWVFLIVGNVLNIHAREKNVHFNVRGRFNGTMRLLVNGVESSQIRGIPRTHCPCTSRRVPRRWDPKHPEKPPGILAP